MTYAGRFRIALFGVAAIATWGATNEPNAQPNPYSTVENYFKMPAGRTWGAAAGVSIDSHNHIWWLNDAARIPARDRAWRRFLNSINRANC